MHQKYLAALDPQHDYWVPAVVAPCRNWAGMQGAHKGSRFLIHRETFEPTREDVLPFRSRANCLQWIMRNRAALSARLSGVEIRAVALDEWLLGLDQAE
ncbi:MAG: hypothetical protein WA979_00935 [Pacificimonas sp.]